MSPTRHIKRSQIKVEVAIYCKEHISAQARQFIQNITDHEFVIIKIDSPIKATIAAVYRAPHYGFEDFMKNLKSLLDYLDIVDEQVIGSLKCRGKTVLELFRSKRYTQLITTATTKKHTLLDHIYISHPDFCLQSGVLHSYHNPVYCILRK